MEGFLKGRGEGPGRRVAAGSVSAAFLGVGSVQGRRPPASAGPAEPARMCLTLRPAAGHPRLFRPHRSLPRVCCVSSQPPGRCPASPPTPPLHRN